MRALFVVICVLASTSVAAAPDDPLYVCKEPGATTKISASFKPDIALADLITWRMGFSCKNIVVAPGIAVRATMFTVLAPNKMTPKQANQLFVDTIESAGLVVVLKPGTIVIKHGPNTPKTCPDLAAAAATQVPTPAPSPIPIPVPAGADDLTKKLAAGIKKLSGTRFEVSKEMVKLLLENPMVVAKGARVVPAMKNGKPEGIKLYAIRPSSLFALVGFQNGDTVLSINGFDLGSADRALEIYAKLRDATSVELALIRLGKPVTLVITIK
jgi:hypothetical protein